MSNKTNDCFQWLSINEDSLFLQDALVKVSDLIPLPSGIETSIDDDSEILTCDSKTTKELSEQIVSLCTRQSHAFSRLLEYRLSALTALWRAQKQFAQDGDETHSQEEAIALLKKQGLWQQSENAPFSSRVSLLLVFPLLQSQSQTDPALCDLTTDLLLQCLRDYPPLSLAKEPSDCLNGLEGLLCSWLGENQSEQAPANRRETRQKENTASALVALACARGSLKTFIRTIHLLQNLPDLCSLPVASILHKLLELEGGLGCPSSVVGSKHILCWDYEDYLAQQSESVAENKESEYRRSVTCDGRFLYTTNSSGHKLAKIGSGYHGTLRGCVYARSLHLAAGLVAWGNGMLLFRPYEFDSDRLLGQFAIFLDAVTLQPKGQIMFPEKSAPKTAVTTIQFCSDGLYFYWFWTVHTSVEKHVKNQPIYFEVFQINSTTLEVIPIQQRLTLQRKDETSKLNESLLSRLRPQRSAASIVTLPLPSTTSSASSAQESTSSTTSCGLPMKTLMKAPIYCCGRYIVILAAALGGSSAASRSLFGSGSNLANLKVLASNVVFNVNDGFSNTKTDLVDASFCALARGAALQGIGTCYDVFNNMIWMASNQWMDHFYNPGRQALHHVVFRLGSEVPLNHPPPADDQILPDVISLIMQHVGITCFHQLMCDLLHLPMSAVLTKEQVIDLQHLARMVDVLEIAIRAGDEKIITCALIALQVVLKMYYFKMENPVEVNLLKKMNTIIWQLLTTPPNVSTFRSSYFGNHRWYGVQAEACHMIVAGLSKLYPSAAEQNNLLCKLLEESQENTPQIYLRDLILTFHAERLTSCKLSLEEAEPHVVSNDVIQTLLDVVTDQSCLSLKKCLSFDRTEFEILLASVPVACAPLQYLCSLLKFYLQHILFIKESKANEAHLTKCQQLVTNFSKMIFTSVYRVLEVLTELCQKLSESNLEDLDHWLNGLERLTRATILGFMMPIIITSFTNKNIMDLNVLSDLLPSLIHLVIQASQTCTYFKHQKSITDKIKSKGDGVNFLYHLKIPTPWASGRTIESIHPVRDNYKFKETVHIPGAHCLYLRFDNRCASQYDYDKLIIHAGPNSNSKKVAEYGGNTLGYGSRSVLGSGWPKDLLKVDGDTVTLSFEMRSGREHNTPDSALWGFAITVNAQENSEDLTSGLPFLIDITLGLSELCCSMIKILYSGPAKTSAETLCHRLLQSELLQRCIWPLEVQDSMAPKRYTKQKTCGIFYKSYKGFASSRSRIPSKIMQSLRPLAGYTLPQMRPSIRDVIAMEIIEEVVISCVLKHLQIFDTVNSKETVEWKTAYELPNILKETYRHFDSVIRHLQMLAELEQNWSSDLHEIRNGKMELRDAFFVDYHNHDLKKKELALLCFVKNIDNSELTEADCVYALQEKLEKEATNVESNTEMFSQTKRMATILVENVELFLFFNLDDTISDTYVKNELDESAIEVSKPIYGRSISAPVFERFKESNGNKQTRQMKRLSFPWQSSLSVDVEHDQREIEPIEPYKSALLTNLFSFLMEHFKNPISSKQLLSAMEIRYWRGKMREQALEYAKEMIVGRSFTHLIMSAAIILQQGPRLDELSWHNMMKRVQLNFSFLMKTIVQLATENPMACYTSVGLLCTIPFTRKDEQCLIQSGLIQLLDHLCSPVTDGDLASEDQSIQQQVSNTSWAGFQVVSNQCITWEKEDSVDAYSTSRKDSGLAVQIANLLMNHLTRAMKCNGNECADHVLQEVLCLLSSLSRSKMGQMILTQPVCVSKLLALLSDHRPSPKLVLIILQLCRVALPLLTTESCTKVEIPTWDYDLTAANELSDEDVPIYIVTLLLAKLGDYITPGGSQTSMTHQNSKQRLSLQRNLPVFGLNRDNDPNDEIDNKDGRLSVSIHKRDDQTSHDIIQPLLSNADNHPYIGNNAEKLGSLDQELTKHNRMELLTDEALPAIEKAVKWTQDGHLVSLSFPTKKSMDQSHRKKSSADTLCREKNVELLKRDPIRPFISGHVANSMALEVISLLRALLINTSNQTWAKSVNTVLSEALLLLPNVLCKIETLKTTACNLNQLKNMACQVNSAFCILGGFREYLKVGSNVTITGEGITNSKGCILSISEQQGFANVALEISAESESYPRSCDVVQVPLSRLVPTNDTIIPLEKTDLMRPLSVALHHLFMSGHVRSPLYSPQPNEGNPVMRSIFRIMAEIQTRACLVLFRNISNESFAKVFLEGPCESINAVKIISRTCDPGVCLPLTEAQCERLRMLYRDCAKPPPPPSKISDKSKKMVWDISRPFPPVRSCLFSCGLTTVTFLGEPSMNSGYPRGTLIYANAPIPHQASLFYWEIQILSFGESYEDLGPIISFGFSPKAEKKDGAWTYPIGTILLHNNGRAMHYNGLSLLQWKSVRLDVSLEPGDVVGCGWERNGDMPPSQQQQPPKGSVFFTYNGCRQHHILNDVSGGMWPVVHIQKKNTRIKTNFGLLPFAYKDGYIHHKMSETGSDSIEEISANFGILPFHSGSDTETDSNDSGGIGVTQKAKKSCRKTHPPCKMITTAKSQREYNSELSMHLKRPLSYTNFALTGPSPHVQLNNLDGSDGEESNDEAQQDLYVLLVKAWESKVFPTIRRRFRNEAERKDGLEQIRGALQLGMTDIARQTVEFLYEENGGIPRDLHLPNLEDIKEESSRFTIEHIRKGMAVVIRNLSFSCTSKSRRLPKFAVHAMTKTFGLTGVVLEVDVHREFVQVETYLRSDGILVRFWYPVDALERPPAGFRKTAVTGAKLMDINDISIQKELLQVEHSLSKMYARQGLLQLIDHCVKGVFDQEMDSFTSASVSNISILKELDVENLLLLSNELLALPSTNGIVGDDSISHCQYPYQFLHRQNCQPSSLFYQNQKQLKNERLTTAIQQATHHGEEYLMELASQLCMCMQVAPEYFPHEEFTIGESKYSTDVCFPGSAFVVISCRMDPKHQKKDGITNGGKGPWAHVYGYTGSQISSCGKPTKQEVVCYPRDAVASANPPAAVGDQYPSVIMFGNRIHLALGPSSMTGLTLAVHAISPELPLAFAFIETLILEKQKSMRSKSGALSFLSALRCEKEEETYANIPSSVMFQIIEYFSNYLWRTDIPAIMKESLFHLLAELLRTVHYSADSAKDSSIFPTLGAQLSPSLALLLQLQSELRKLYDEELRSWSGSGISIGGNEFIHASSYFHALMEVSLAVAEVTSPITPVLYGSGFSLMASIQGGSSPPPSIAPTSPSTSSKRKKLKAKRDRDRMSPKSRSSSRSPRGSICEGESIMSGHIIGNLSIGSIDKPEDTLWFHRALTISQILRFLVYKDSQGLAALNDAISDSNQSLMVSTISNRLLLISGIPTQLKADEVKECIRLAMNSCGGVYKDEIFVPTDSFILGKNYSTSSTDAKSESSASLHRNEAEIIKSYAVVEVRSASKLETARKMLCKKDMFTVKRPNLVSNLSNNDIYEGIHFVSNVESNLNMAKVEDLQILELYLKSKVFSNVNEMTFHESALRALADIFFSCFVTSSGSSSDAQPDTMLYVTKDQILNSMTGNLLHLFFSNAKLPKITLSDYLVTLISQYGIGEFALKELIQDDERYINKETMMKHIFSKDIKQKQSVILQRLCLKERNHQVPENDDQQVQTSDEGKSEENKYLLFKDFLNYICSRCQEDVRAVWNGLIACGYDTHFDRCACSDMLKVREFFKQWSNDVDTKLVQYADKMCTHLGITASRLHPHEVYLSQSELVNPEFAFLQDIPIELLRLRFALLQSVNNGLETFFLPLVDLRPSSFSFPHSTAALLSMGRNLIFYDTKIALTNCILNATALRKADQAAPEIILDPLEIIGTDMQDVTSTQFCQAMRQLSEVSSTQFCVRLASGGDPTFSFNVRHIGEEVLGTSGSFRHFVSQFSKELHDLVLGQLLLCPNDAVDINQGKYVLRPGLMTFSEEQMMIFLGQMLGITLRADIPLPLDFLQSTWKSLIGLHLDLTVDLKDADFVTYSYLEKLSSMNNEEELIIFLKAYNNPALEYIKMSGEEVELIPNGRNIKVDWNNYQQYVELVKKCRINELMAKERIAAIRLGLASVVPLQLLNVMSPLDLDLRICGMPYVDLHFLKAHTMYQVGLMETDTHIEFFWSSLESFSQEELRKFIKFACNQDRIPSNCPCRDGRLDASHVPPYPMKIAPPDGKSGQPDSRHIRAETCLFMIKLPQYSCLEIMRERLLLAMHCMEDPLSG